MTQRPKKASPNGPRRNTGSNAATRTENLRQRLERQILSGELPPGFRLDEQSIAATNKVSRTPVREALRQLASSGLVEMRSRHTPVVAILTIPKLIQMFEVMAELEGLCARLATRRVTLEQRKELKIIHERLKKALKKQEPLEFYEVNRQFHELISQASGSEFLSEQTNQLRNRVEPHRRHVTYRPGRMVATIEEHERVLKAMLAGDAEGAGRAMRDHVNLLGENLTDFIAALPADVLPKAS